MKKTSYFSHDSNARNDEKVIPLLHKHGWLGYGLYWALNEKLRDANGYKLERNYEALAFDLRVEQDIVKDIVENFKLYKLNNTFFYSETLKQRMLIMEERSVKARESANKRWNKGNTNAMRTQCDGNAIKVKESKVNKSKVTKKIVDEFITLFNSITNKKFISDDKIKHSLNARLNEGFTMDDFKKAIINCSLDSFHIESGLKHLTPEFITRSNKLQKYLNVAKTEGFKPKNPTSNG